MKPQSKRLGRKEGYLLGNSFSLALKTFFLALAYGWCWKVSLHSDILPRDISSSSFLVVIFSCLVLKMHFQQEGNGEAAWRNTVRAHVII